MTCKCIQCYNTRLVAEWLRKDPAARRRIVRGVNPRNRDYFCSKQPAGTVVPHPLRGEVARSIHRELWTDEVMNLPGWLGDLLRSALSDIDCHAIAEEFLPACIKRADRMKKKRS